MSEQECYWCEAIQKEIDTAKANNNPFWEMLKESDLKLHKKRDHPKQI